ncbi:MAG TPA: sulfatase-like hydrolase/transferase, partial [bacterium]|nr:sulfatase-like hydrolase/transferase [bacterium]
VPPEGYVDKVRLASDPTTLNDGGSFSAKHWALMADSERPSDADISAGMMLYDACIRSIDDAIGRLASYLDETGLTNRSLVIVTADHGEAFWEHGVCRHGTNVYDEAIKVPLVIAFPDGRYSGREISSQVELIDLMPSVLEAVGVPDSAHREGTSLIGLLEGGKHLRRPGSALPAGVTFSQSTLRDALGTRCLRTAEWKLILEPATALVQLYNLKADPAETRNLWGTGLTVGDSLHSLLLGLPGSRIRGWRIAFTGATGEVTYTVTSATASTAGVPRAEWLVHSTRKHHRIQTSGGSAEVQAAPTGLSLALVDFGGASDELTFAVDAEGAGAPESVYVGKSLSVPLGAVGKLRPETAYGLPDKFQDHRQNGRPGAFIWWLPGGKLDSSAETAPLGEQEKKRLKSIGYTH